MSKLYYFVEAKMMSWILSLVFRMHQDALLEMIPSTEFDLGKKLIGLDTIHHQIQNFSNYFVELPIAVFYVLCKLVLEII